MRGLQRRSLVLGTAAAAGSFLAGTTHAAPLALTVYDVAGALTLMQRAFENFRAANPGSVARITYTRAPAPELAGKLRAQQAAGRTDIDLVLSGSDGLAAGLELGLWERLLPDHASALPDLPAILDPAALRLTEAQGGGYGVAMCYYPSGPLLEYLPARVPEPPKSAQALLAWAKAYPNRFIYARPDNSGPGRTFMMGLPYLLGDKDPADPVSGWDKSWAYLQELNRYIEYYPTSTSATMKELGDGSRDLVVSTTGWDINPRALGIVPEEAAISALHGFHWISDADYMCVPKGLPPERLQTVLELMSFVLRPASQAYAYDDGFLYPGPAVRDVPITMAPQHSQDVIAKFGRPEYAALIADNPIEVPLRPDRLVAAFRKWDELVGRAPR